MKKIMIALDCTSFAKEVALAGKELAKQYPDASVTMMHALLQPDYYSSAQYAPILGFNEYYNKDLSDIFNGDTLQNAVQDFLESLKEELSMTNAQILIRPGEPEETIMEAARETQAALLVIGKQNKDTANKKRIGHVTEAILKQAYLPVLVIPTASK